MLKNMYFVFQFLAHFDWSDILYSLLSKIYKFGIYDEATLRLHLAFEGRQGNLKGGWFRNKTKWISEDDAKSSKIFVEIYFV